MKPSETFCREILPEVSRTFALTIPVLPAPLDLAVTVAYLLCRIADTLEDEARGDLAEREALFRELARLTSLPPDWREATPAFVQRTIAVVSEQAPQPEVQLLKGTAQVLQSLAGLPAWTHGHIARCLAVMTGGMAASARALEGRAGPAGLANLEATLSYCYYVAGVVGEMLTGMFIEYDREVASRREALVPRSAAFGRALQLTNILKDIRKDLERGTCWLPADRLAAWGLSPATLAEPAQRHKAVALLNELVSVARNEADIAFEYALALPSSQPGLRLFCLWPLFLAVLTLAALEGNPAVFDRAPVKIGRDAVQAILLAAQEAVGSDEALRSLYFQKRGRPS